MTIRPHHSDQEDETAFDNRIDADDDLEKRKIRFPNSKLYGRGEELATLQRLFDRLLEPEGQGQVVLIDGYSGVGKSALVDGLLQNLKKASTPHLYSVGKYNEKVGADPFSGLSQAMYHLTSDLLLADDNGEKLRMCQENLKRAGLWKSERDAVLVEMLPALRPLFDHEILDDDGPPTPTAVNRRDLKQLAIVLTDFFKAICSPRYPLVLFLDDLQWVDPASLEVIGTLLLSAHRIHHMLFVGSYRSNEVKDGGPVHKMISSSDFDRIHLSNLSIEQVQAFMAETLGMETEAVGSLTELIYSRTLGNIFFCRQAMEELVRKNAIYYDVMFFQWQFSLDGVEQNTLLSSDVSKMIQSKLEALPSQLRRVLVIASYLSNIINIPVLFVCVQADGMPLTAIKELRKHLDEAIDEGLLLKADSGRTYKFIHDRVQEAAYDLVPEGPCREGVLATIAKVLLDFASNHSVSSPPPWASSTSMSTKSDFEWMLFVAADYCMSVSKQAVAVEPLRLAELYLQVSTISLTRGAYHRAVEFLRAGVSFLKETQSPWSQRYDLSLALFNHLIETGFDLGHVEQTEAAIEEVLTNAASLKDQSTANYTKVRLAVRANNQNYILGALESIKMLKKYGQNIPEDPTKRDIFQERLRLTVALGIRNISVLAEQPKAKDDYLMKLIFQLCHLVCMAKNNPLNKFVSLRAMRVSLEQGITMYLPNILVFYTVPYRMKGRFDKAYSYGSIAAKICSRFPEARSQSHYTDSQMMLNSGVLPLRISYQDGMEAQLSTYKIALAACNIQAAMVSAMHFPMHYFAAGFPLNALLEPKLILFETQAKDLNKPSFIPIFQCCRQFLYNLQGKASNPTMLEGEVMSEDKILDGLEGNVRNMTSRDFSIFRMALAYIFDDEATMELVMERLDSFPLFDLPLVRQHLRLTYHGLAALSIGRRKVNKALRNKGRLIMKEMRQLERQGSENAHPVYRCFVAVDKHTKKAYDQAMEACINGGLVHLEAMMSERCGLMLQEQQQEEASREYLCRALWLFNDWGATGKVKCMRAKYPFLKRTRPKLMDGSTSSACSSSIRYLNPGQSADKRDNFSSRCFIRNRISRSSNFKGTSFQTETSTTRTRSSLYSSRDSNSSIPA